MEVEDLQQQLADCQKQLTDSQKQLADSQKQSAELKNLLLRAQDDLINKNLLLATLQDESRAVKDQLSSLKEDYESFQFFVAQGHFEDSGDQTAFNSAANEEAEKVKELKKEYNELVDEYKTLLASAPKNQEAIVESSEEVSPVKDQVKPSYAAKADAAKVLPEPVVNSDSPEYNMLKTEHKISVLEWDHYFKKHYQRHHDQPGTWRKGIGAGILCKYAYLFFNGVDSIIRKNPGIFVKHTFTYYSDKDNTRITKDEFFQTIFPKWQNNDDMSSFKIVSKVQSGKEEEARETLQYAVTLFLKKVDNQYNKDHGYTVNFPELEEEPSSDEEL